MNRIDKKFADLKARKKKAFIAFITAGDPSLKTTEQLVLEFENSGVDIVELGVPFSDPLADGPTIQAASERSLKNGTTLPKILDLVARLRTKTDMPIALMMYYNQIFHYGEEKFIKRVKQCGVDGLIIPDLPPEEAASLCKLAKKAEVATVFFMSPTTSQTRMKRVAKSATGFVYYVSIAGVTGARTKLSNSYISQIKKAKKLTSTPVCIGFGISTPTQVKTISKNSDGVIVGSAIINEILRNKGNKNLVKNVSAFVRRLVQSL